MHKNKILLVNPPYVVFTRTAEPCLPLGLGYVSSFLESYGFDVSIFNADWMPYTIFTKPIVSNKSYDYKQKENHWLKIKNCMVKLLENVDILGIAVSTPSYGSALKIAKIAKDINPNVVIVAGGIHPSIMPGKTLKEDNIDIVVIGEGEHTMLDLANNLPNKKSLYNIPGICFRDEQGEAIFTKRRDFIENLDLLPSSNRKFISSEGRYDMMKIAPIIASRGCCFKCSFCSRHAVMGTNVRYRSADNIAEEIVYLKRKYRINRFDFKDDTFGVNNLQVNRLCDILLSKGINISWGCQTRAGILDFRMLRLMRRAGCFGVSIGVESGNPDMLKKIKKNISIDRVVNSAADIKRAGIKLGCNFIIGYREETEKTLQDTEKLINKIKPDGINLSLLIPYPGSEIFDKLSEENRLKTYDWTLYNAKNPDLFVRDNMPYDKLVMHRERILKNFLIKMRLKKFTNIKYIINDLWINRKCPVLFVEMLKQFVYDIFKYLSHSY